MVMTKRGIYHNLKESEYAISNGEIAYFFSSRLYMRKFLEEYHEHRKQYRKKIARAMIVDEMNTDMLADIHLYKDIEKRGFRVIKFLSNIMSDGWVELTWQELHQFALHKMTEKSMRDWLEIHVQKSDEPNGTMELTYQMK